eukprot:7828241-Lingulodinium_polyedra.AAC.1
MRSPCFGVRIECARRAICEPLQQQTADSTASLRTVSTPVHNDAVESTVCRHNGAQITRLTHSM